LNFIFDDFFADLVLWLAGFVVVVVWSKNGWIQSFFLFVSLKSLSLSSELDKRH